MRVAILFLLVFSYLDLVYGKTISYGEEPVAIKMVYRQTHFLIFDKPVASISRSGKFRIEPAEVKKYNYTRFSVIPRFKKGSSRISFVLDDNTAVELKLETVLENIDYVTYRTYSFKSKGQKQATKLTKMLRIL